MFYNAECSSLILASDYSQGWRLQKKLCKTSLPLDKQALQTRKDTLTSFFKDLHMVSYHFIFI